MTMQYLLSDSQLKGESRGGRIVFYRRGINTRYVASLSGDWQALEKGDYSGDYDGTWTAEIRWK